MTIIAGVEGKGKKMERLGKMLIKCRSGMGCWFFLCAVDQNSPFVLSK